MEVFALTTMTPFAEPQWSWEDWQALGSLNSGVLFINKSLEMTVYNGLAAQLLNVVVPIGQAVPLQQCLAPEREEYQVLSAIVTFEREFRNHVLTWAGDGSIRHVLMDSFKKENSAGSVDGMYVVMKDLGNFTVLEQHMQKTDKLATLGKIAAGIAHEIRNPMTTIKGFLQVMETRFAFQNMNEELQYTQVMLQEIDRVNALVSELLLLSRPHHVEKTVCSMETILAELYPLIESQTLLRSINFECTTGKLPSIVADSNMLKQVLLNLVKNALEAMDDGGTLKISATADGAWVRVDVSDTGPGIPYYLMDRIFDAFYTTKDKGTGLGLPICQRIVADHGGEIRVSSKGFGTTFSVLLPYDKEADHTPS
jgi:two-component system, sporulation sensor kinase E